MKSIRNVALASICLATVTPASAATIIYTVSGTGTGTVGGQAFAGGVTISASGDTAAQQQCISGGSPVAGCYFIPIASSDLSLGSLGHYSLANNGIMFVNNAANVVGFSEIVLPGPIVNTFAFVNNGGAPSAAFSTWNGISNLGPITTSLGLNKFFRPLVATSGGDLILDNISEVGPATFSASLGAAVPEPSSWLMLTLGFGAIGAALRRRQNVSVRFA